MPKYSIKIIVAFFGKNLSIWRCFVLFLFSPRRTTKNKRLPFPVKIFDIKRVFTVIKMSDNENILNETTNEIVVVQEGAEESSLLDEAVGPVHVHKPIIPLIDLVSESGSESEKVSSSSGGPTDTSTPITDPARWRRVRFDVRIEHMRCLVQENERFNDLAGQPNIEIWPENLNLSELRQEYAQMYAVCREEYPEILEASGLPHPSVVESGVEGNDGAEGVAEAETGTQGSTTSYLGDSTPEVPINPLEPEVYAAPRQWPRQYQRQRSRGYSSPNWPPRPLLERPTLSVRPGPLARAETFENYLRNPRPSTSTWIPPWEETKRVLKPINEESKKLLTECYANENELSRILNFKPKFEDHSTIAEVFNNAISKNVGRRARFLQVWKQQQQRMEYYIRAGMSLPNPNAGYAAEETREGQVNETQEPSSEEATEKMCSPQNCVCGDDDCVWGKANYTN